MHILRYLQRLAPHVSLQVNSHEFGGKKQKKMMVMSRAVTVVGGKLCIVHGPTEFLKLDYARPKAFTEVHAEMFTKALISLRWEVMQTADDAMILGEIERLLETLKDYGRLQRDAIEAMEYEPPSDFDLDS
jgi:hypothetical protein